MIGFYKCTKCSFFGAKSIYQALQYKDAWKVGQNLPTHQRIEVSLCRVMHCRGAGHAVR